MNEYKPWEEKDMTQLEYYMSKYIAARTDLEEAVDLLEECLEWDNGCLPQERGYSKIIDFINRCK